MKNIIVVIMLMIGLLISLVPSESTGATTSASIEAAPSTGSGTTISATASSKIEASIGDPVPVEKGNFFARNWGALLMGLLGFADVVTRLTPTEKDNSIINFLSTIINVLIPNLKKGGGSFKLESK